MTGIAPEINQRGTRPVLVLSLVERGWQAARTLSVELPAERFHVLHVVKGWVPRSVRRLIEPKPHVQLVSVPRALFWPSVGLLALRLALRPGARAIWVDNERSQRRLGRWGRPLRIAVALIRQGTNGCEVWVGGEQVSGSAWQQRIAGACGLR